MDSALDDSRPRTPLSARLNSLLNASPRSSLDSLESASTDECMRRPPRLSRPPPSTGAALRTQGNMPPPHLQPVVPQLSSEPNKPDSLPVLRWLGTWSESSAATCQKSPSQPSSPPSPSSALQEALDDDIFAESHSDIQRPPQARLPPSFANRTPFRRSPPFFENLARSTLPTSSVTRLPPSVQLPVEGQRDHADAPIILNQSPPTRTSVDSLRSLRDRGMGLHTSATQNVSPSPTAGGWWYRREHKDSVDDLLDRSDRADTVEGEDVNIRQKYRAPRHPVVFCHGLLGFDSVQIGPAIAPLSVSHWRGIKEVLEANGTEVLITRVPATSSPVERAKVLEAKISETYPGRSVHLIGHSMGGLDCRYLTTHLTHRLFDVLSITTIATPHRGSAFADHFLSAVGKERMPSVLSLLDMLPNGGGDGKAFECLTLESMRRFNADTPDVNGVQYFSWGAVFEPGLIDTFRWPHSVILEKEGPNDGLVSVASSKWGTYLGTLEDVNHLDLVGWINTARYKWAEFTGREIKFKPATFYLGVADHLARVVEGQSENARRDSRNADAEGTRAGDGVSTVEGVEHRGPAHAGEATGSKDAETETGKKRRIRPAQSRPEG